MTETKLAVGDRVWWQHTIDYVRYGTVRDDKVSEVGPFLIGVRADDDPDLVYVEDRHLNLFAELPDGMYGWVRDSDYHSSSRLSSTGARLLVAPSVPALFKHRQDNPEKPKRIYDVGHVAHRLVLSKGAEFEVLDPAIHGLKRDGGTSDSPRATAAWKEAEADVRARGIVPIHVDDFDAAVRMSDAIFDHPEAARLLLADDGQAEMSLYATPNIPNVPLRARPDWMVVIDGRLWIVDVKTSVTADPEKFARHGAKLGYHIQAAFYRIVAQLLGLDSDPVFVFAVVEKEPPHLVSVVEYDTEAMDEGARQVWRAINTFAECTASGKWPGYDTAITPISLPLWLLDDEMNIA